MKKMALVLGFMALGAFSFAQDFKVSVGGGVNYAYDFSSSKSEVTGAWLKEAARVNKLGFELFGDFTYATIYLNYGMDISKTQSDLETDSSALTTTESETNSKDFSVSLYGKFPINLMKELAVYPLIGVGYNVNLDVKGKDTMAASKKESLNYLFLGAGLGLDFIIVDNIFVRGYGIFNFAPDYGKKYREVIYADPTLKVTSNGYEIKAGLNVGYKF